MMSLISQKNMIVAVIAAVASIACLWFFEMPLGVPGEWAWEKIEVSDDRFYDALLGWITAILAAAAYIAFVWVGARQIERSGRFVCAGWLVGLAVAGFAWLTVLQDSPSSEEYRLSRLTWVIYYPRSSGYFFEARYHVSDVSQFLAGYEDRMAEGDVLHIGTHPPGLFLLYRGLMWLCEHSELLREFAIQTQPPSVVEAFAIIAENSSTGSTPLLQQDRAVIWLAALITQSLGVATVIPLFYLIRRHCSRLGSWLPVSLWPLVPALAIFLPKSDVLFPFLGTTFLVCWLEGVRRKSVVLCISAGIVFWLAMCCSLAIIPVGVLAVVLTAWELWFSNASTSLRWRRAVSVGWTAGSFFAATLLAWAVFDLNLLWVWWLNYQNHAAFYDQFPRTWWKWLFVNPLELGFAVGFPIAFLAVVSLTRTLTTSRANWQLSHAPIVCCALVGGVLWLSGKNMGEAARLWLVIQPWVIWLAAATFPLEETKGSEKCPAALSGWILLMWIQAVVCIATVTRVSGFHYSDL